MTNGICLPPQPAQYTDSRGPYIHIQYTIQTSLGENLRMVIMAEVI